MTISLLLSLLLSCTMLIGTRVNGDDMDMTAGCLNSLANNYDPGASIDDYDENDNSVCLFESCDVAQMTCPGQAYDNGGFFQCMNMGHPYGDPPCDEIYGCLNSLANNYDPGASIDGYDTDGNSVCLYYFCDDAQRTCPGRAYDNGLYDPIGGFFQCIDHLHILPPGSTPCGGDTGGGDQEPTKFKTGCMDPFAVNNDDSATEAGYDQNGDSVCMYQWCDAAQQTCAGFAYTNVVDGDVVFQCNQYSLPLLNGYNVVPCGNFFGAVGCRSEFAINQNAAATEDGTDQNGNSVCMFASCDEAQKTCPGQAYPGQAKDNGGLFQCITTKPQDSDWNACGGTSATDCPGLEGAFSDNCNCEKEYTSSGSLGLVVSATDCYGLEEAYKANCACEQWASDTKHEEEEKKAEEEEKKAEEEEKKAEEEKKLAEEEEKYRSS